jgi:hypothetical protein
MPFKTFIDKKDRSRLLSFNGNEFRSRGYFLKSGNHPGLEMRLARTKHFLLLLLAAGAIVIGMIYDAHHSGLLK